ncbi:hypothetical protein AAE02nite_17050 [Adhaeribacter aerolatus]|uniref:Uncharacterized protein n=2 Tax=Adhaeribacter aerolatus TaxID=670289 RepID=A0A512AWF0_9BACT|nr:hypothetical protein AAE02nite_17050 [Adhaeribacter aerolatus]
MISQTGTNFDGSPIKTDVSKIKQYKIITPTHWMFIVKNIASDTVSQGANFGEYTLTGNKYVEKVQGATTDYTVRVEGDKFYMKGALITDDGRKAYFDEVYKKVPGVVNTNKSIIGTWDLISSYRMDGANKVMDETGIKQIQIISPTHFMNVEIKGQKLDKIMLGSYTTANNKTLPKIILATLPIDPNLKIEVTNQVQGDKLISTGSATWSNGGKSEWGNTFQKLSPKSSKEALSTK